MFRNREVRLFAVLFALATAAGAAAGFAIHPAAGTVILIFAAALGTVFFVFTRNRYRRLAQLADQIDLVLHNEERLFTGEAEEGELSILHSEITKMTLRIREQNESLKKEKSRLADSMADIAHQLRTPLTSANLILTLLKDCTDEKERKTLLRETEELFIQMEWLVASLLKISRLDAGIVVFHREQVKVNRLIASALHPFLIPMELHNVRVQINVPEGAVMRGDQGWLSEAIRNILKNCMESVGDNGIIEIECKDTLLYTEITIHDSGPGFQKEDLSRLFERFYRGKKDSGSGYGIGLALCKMIITGQGGTVAAGNHPLGGAVFSIRFPK